jgi:hypothetical protein
LSKQYDQTDFIPEAVNSILELNYMKFVVYVLAADGDI